jgi:alpha-1,2-mannosyltransferase
LIDSDFPSRYPVGDKTVVTYHPPREPRYVWDEENWERVLCEKFLDARASSRLTRAFWLPLGERWEGGNKWGEMCLLKRKGKGEIKYW